MISSLLNDTRYKMLMYSVYFPFAAVDTEGFFELVFSHVGFLNAVLLNDYIILCYNGIISLPVERGETLLFNTRQ